MLLLQMEKFNSSSYDICIFQIDLGHPIQLIFLQQITVQDEQVICFFVSESNAPSRDKVQKPGYHVNLKTQTYPFLPSIYSLDGEGGMPSFISTLCQLPQQFYNKYLLHIPSVWRVQTSCSKEDLQITDLQKMQH